MKLSAVVLALLLLLPPAVAEASCALNPRVVGNEVRWDSPAGTVQFSLVETIDGVAPLYLTTKLNSYPIKRRTTAPVTARYIITAELTSGTQARPVGAQAIESLDACVATIDVELQPDAELRALTRKVVVPIVGSTAGAFGGRFRTSLELRGGGTTRGRVVFRPAGRPPSDSDPSLPYSFTSSKPLLFWDDVVATMGQSGLGSIEIIPDEGALDIVPAVTARLYNETSFGTFGAEVPAVLPIAYLDGRSLEVPIPDARFRVNIGLRTFTATKVKAVSYSPSGRLLGFKDHTFPAGWTQLTNAADFSGEKLEPGSSVTLLVSGGAVLFYSVTENQTNDLTVVLAPTLTRNVGKFVY